MGGRATEEGRPWKRQRVGNTQHDFSVAFPFSDVKLVSGSGAVLYGSRYNLALRSPVCKQMLLSGMKETQPMSEVVTIPFPGMRTKVLQVLLDFCTAGRFSHKLVRKAPVEVIHAARYFQLTDCMEELVARVVAKLSALARRVHIPLARVARMLTLALQCLPTDLDASFFELLMKIIFTWPVEGMPYMLSPQTLGFLLSKTVRCWEPWASTFPFYPSELSLFHYLLQWSAFQSENGQQFEKPGNGQEVSMWSACQTGNGKQLKMWFYHGNPDILEKADLLESIATLAQPFLAFIDFSLIDPRDIVRLIQPLKIVPADMLLEALSHHALAPRMSKPILYRGSFVLQWHPDAHSPGLVIDEKSGGRDLYCDSDTSGCARSYSCLKGGGERSWTVIISFSSHPGGIGVGFCSDEVNYSQWLGHSSNGWILDGRPGFGIMATRQRPRLHSVLSHGRSASDSELG